MLAVCLFQFLMDKVIDQAMALQWTVASQAACNSNKENQSECKYSDRDQAVLGKFLINLALHPPPLLTKNTKRRPRYL